LSDLDNAAAGYGGAVPPAPPGPGSSPFASIRRVPRTGSTNADVARALRGDPAGGADDWPHLSVLVADHQAAGRGRAGRGWETPPGTSLTASVVLRPRVPPARWTWLGLLGGLAVARAVQARTGLAVGLKWPNDVLLLGVGGRVAPGWGHDRKVAGVLAEAVRPVGAPPSPAEAGPAAVLGFGVNVNQAAEDLPVAWATSLAAAGADASARDLDALLAAVGERLAALLGPWEAAGGDAVRCGLAADVAAACVTLGREVRITSPSGGEIQGRALGLGEDGSLEVRLPGGPELHVTVGDVDHIRTVSG
jgi:BirA family biotin operon repressor/biotin-[acetyl-CoA-carboxylase] ligase